MSNKRLINILLLCLLAVSATAGGHRVVRWTGTELVRNDSVSYQRSVADNGVFGERTRLPYLSESFAAGTHRNRYVLSDAKYMALSPFESESLGGHTLPEEPEITTYVTRENGMLREVVLIDPYVTRSGKTMKLASYSLRAEATDEVVTTATNYAAHSALRTGKWVKIRVSESGLHRLPHSTLRGMGLDPAKTRVCGYGGAPLQQDLTKTWHDDLPEMAAYDDGNALIFYAQGPLRWEYNASKGRYEHTQNPYSNHGYYFLTDSGEGNPKRCATLNAPETDGIQYDINTFVDHQVYEKDEINLLQRDGHPGGREFYEEGIANNDKLTIRFDVPNLVDTLRSYAVFDAAANCGKSSNASLLVGNTSGLISFNYNESVIRAGESGRTLVSLYAPAGNSLTATITYHSPTDNGRFYLNYVELHAQRALVKGRGPLAFNNSHHVFNAIPGVNGFIYHLSGASAQCLVFDITNPIAMSLTPAEPGSGALTLRSSATLHEYVAVERDELAALPVPENAGNVDNQDIHALSDVDMLIVSNKMFLAQAQQLADAHEDIDGLRTAVVTDEQVYNEFSSGNADATAIRRLCKKLHETGSRPLRYLLLMGDGSFDNRRLLTNSGNNLMITYQSSNSLYEPLAYSMDDYFAFTDTGDGLSDSSGKVNLGVGRLPANTQEEAQQMVDKTIAYMSGSKYGDWRRQIVFLADDGDANMLHTWQADSVAQGVRKQAMDFAVNKMYLEAYQQEIMASGERYPIAKNKLDNFFKNGMLVFNYTGHGSTLSITSEQMLMHTEARDMTSENLSLWVLATCSFSHYDTRDKCIAEYALLNPAGAAVGVFSATRTVFAAQNLEINRQVMLKLFAKQDGEWPRIGDALMQAKNDITLDKNKSDYDAGNRLAYCLLGDPAVRLKYPEPYIAEATEINGMEPSLQDTVRALEEVVIKGHVADRDGNTITDFNGQVSITLQDKEAKVKMLNNDGMNIDDDAKDFFLDRNSTLFRGKAEVKDGLFEVSMMIPKDIHYNYGTGRLEFYACDTTMRADALGYEEKFIIGGSAQKDGTDEQGPNLDIYLNSTAFRSGDKVNATPLFLAFIEDEHGINTAGSGIGHDLVLTIDGDAKQTYNLNDYFSTAGKYTTGTVEYLMPQMQPGRHSLTFRAWDLFNNSTTKSLDFEVVNNLGPRLIDVLVYPNPVRTGESLNIVITHDRPNAALHTAITIYDLQGRKVWQQSQNSGERIEVAVPTTNLAAGIYIYRLEAKTNNSDTTTKVGQIMVR